MRMRNIWAEGGMLDVTRRIKTPVSPCERYNMFRVCSLPSHPFFGQCFIQNIPTSEHRIYGEQDRYETAAESSLPRQGETRFVRSPSLRATR